MKKLPTLALLLSISLVFTACGNNAKENKPEEPAPTENATTQMGDLLSTSYSELMKSGTYFMHYNATIDTQEESVSAEFKVAFDGTTISTTVITQGMTMRHLLKDGTTYFLDDTNKTYMKMDIPQNESPLEDTSTMEYTGKGTETLDGKSMDYEEYTIPDGVLRYYFEGKKLSRITIKTTQETSTLEIIELSDQVSPDMVSIPSDYTEGLPMELPPNS